MYETDDERAERLASYRTGWEPYERMMREDAYVDRIEGMLMLIVIAIATTWFLI